LLFLRIFNATDDLCSSGISSAVSEVTTEETMFIVDIFQGEKLQKKQEKHRNDNSMLQINSLLKNHFTPVLLSLNLLLP